MVKDTVARLDMTTPGAGINADVTPIQTKDIVISGAVSTPSDTTEVFKSYASVSRTFVESIDFPSKSPSIIDVIDSSVSLSVENSPTPALASSGLKLFMTGPSTASDDDVLFSTLTQSDTRSTHGAEAAQSGFPSIALSTRDVLTPNIPQTSQVHPHLSGNSQTPSNIDESLTQMKLTPRDFLTQTLRQAEPSTDASRHERDVYSTQDISQSADISGKLLNNSKITSMTETIQAFETSQSLVSSALNSARKVTSFSSADDMLDEASSLSGVYSSGKGQEIYRDFIK